MGLVLAPASRSHLVSKAEALVSEGKTRLCALLGEEENYILWPSSPLLGSDVDGHAGK